MQVRLGHHVFPPPQGVPSFDTFRPMQRQSRNVTIQDQSFGFISGTCSRYATQHEG